MPRDMLRLKSLLPQERYNKREIKTFLPVIFLNQNQQGTNQNTQITQKTEKDLDPPIDKLKSEKLARIINENNNRKITDLNRNRELLEKKELIERQSDFEKQEKLKYLKQKED